MYFWRSQEEEIMRWMRIRSVVLHAFHHLTHSVETWVDIFWFPITQTTVFAAIAVYFARQAGESAAEAVVLGIILWYAMEAGSYAIAVGMLWEVWARNFSTLFASPLTLQEFLAGQMIFGLVKQLLTVGVLGVIGYLVFQFNILALGVHLPLVLILLMSFGWAMGLVALGLILRFGTRIQSVAWGLIYILQPVVGVFYPVSVLPAFAQAVAYGLPPTYVFIAARQIMGGEAVQWNWVLVPIGLTIVYGFVAYRFVLYAWNYARNAGTLAQMEG